MQKYKVSLIFSNGERLNLDGEFDSYDEAFNWGAENASATRVGAETLHLSNPGDYPIDNYEDPDIEVFSIE